MTRSLRSMPEMVNTIGDALSELDPSQVTYEVIAHPSAVDGIIDYASDHSCDLIRDGEAAALGRFAVCSAA